VLVLLNRVLVLQCAGALNRFFSGVGKVRLERHAAHVVAECRIRQSSAKRPEVLLLGSSGSRQDPNFNLPAENREDLTT
jgi:hypothetical protein